jgi:hypothetical protein
LGQDTLWDLNSPETYEGDLGPLDVKMTELSTKSVNRLKAAVDKLTNSSHLLQKLKNMENDDEIEDSTSPDEELSPIGSQQDISRKPNENSKAPNSKQNGSGSGKFFFGAVKTDDTTTSWKNNRNIKTADLLQTEYRTWYATSHFAKTHHGKPPKKRKPKDSLPPIFDSNRIFRQLNPLALTEVNTTVKLPDINQ